MINLLKTSIIAGILLFVFTGCGAQKVLNIQKAPLSINKEISIKKMYKAIKNAGYRRGWQISKVSPGVAKAYINVRGRHQATVLITYSHNEYSINYKDSEHLKYNAQNNTIHKNYNSWVKNLDKDINFELNSLGE